MGTSQPPTESMIVTLQNSEFDTGLNMDAVLELTKHFKAIREEMSEAGLISDKVLGVDIQSLWFQVPGGMLSNLVSQLQLQGTPHLLPQVLEEIPKVREDLGYPPLVTPTSQMVGAQALINVMAGERYKMIPKEVKSYVKGMYGRPPAPIRADIMEKVLGNEEPITNRPADYLEPSLPKFREEIGSLAKSEEDVLSYALFPDIAKKYFENRG